MRNPDREQAGTGATPAAMVLERVREQSRAVRTAQASELEAVVCWADLHRVETPLDLPAASQRSAPGPYGTEGVLFLAGPEARGLAEFAVCELAAGLGVSERAARFYVGQAVELRDRLPRLYAKTIAGLLPVPRAREIAEQTRLLSPEAAAFVDAHLAEFDHKINRARIRRCLAAAFLHCDPDTARDRAEQAAEQRRVEVLDHLDGISALTAVLHTPDAAGLEHRVTIVAEWLAVLGDEDSRDVRRARALALLADPQAALDFEQDCYDHVHGSAVDEATDTRRPTAPAFHLHLHTTAEGALSPVVRVEGAGRRLPVPLAAVEQWLQELAPGTTMRITPVVDTREQIAVDSYEVPVRLAQQVDETHSVCVFPYCGRRGRYDLDHIIEYVPPDEGGPPGQTSTQNLARLCRFHHRVKTHSAWSYLREPDRALTWASPTGARFRVDPTGTTRLPRP